MASCPIYVSLGGVHWRSSTKHITGEGRSVDLCSGQHCGGESVCQGPLLHTHTEGQEDDNNIFCGEHRLSADKISLHEMMFLLCIKTRWPHWPLPWLLLCLPGKEDWRQNLTFLSWICIIRLRFSTTLELPQWDYAEVAVPNKLLLKLIFGKPEKCWTWTNLFSLKKKGYCWLVCGVDVWANQMGQIGPF